MGATEVTCSICTQTQNKSELKDQINNVRNVQCLQEAQSSCEVVGLCIKRQQQVEKCNREK